MSDEINKEEVFEYLDDLRNSGVVNMFGAAPYVAEVFMCSKIKARELLAEWMHTSDKTHT